MKVLIIILMFSLSGFADELTTSDLIVDPPGSVISFPTQTKRVDLHGKTVWVTEKNNGFSGIWYKVYQRRGNLTRFGTPGATIYKCKMQNVGTIKSKTYIEGYKGKEDDKG